MKKIIFTRADGGLSVVHPVINTHPVPEDITEQQALERAFARLPAEAIDPQIVDESAIPSDRTFRAAWKAVGKSIEHDMDKCREIHKTKLRELRSPKFEPIERAQRTALVNGDTATARTLEANLQALRDVTNHPAIAAAVTPEELKAVIPDALK